MSMRRQFITLLSGAAAAWPLAARAQDVRKIPRIGILDFFPSAASVDFIEPFRQALRELGHVEGQNILVEYHSAEQGSERAAVIAADLVRREASVRPPSWWRGCPN
jgi:putative ABC transport system substrate-binding protein